MKIGIIGSGAMGRHFASKFADLGHTVSIANSRGPASLQQFAAETGTEAATVEEAMSDKDVIIVSIPQKNVPELPKPLFAKLPKGVVVIDTCNYYPDIRDGVIPELEQSGIDSLWVQEQLGVPLVKVFNSITAESITTLGRPKGDNDRIALAVSGDNAKKKETAFGLVEALGFDPFDVGTIAQSWKQQPGSSIYCRDLRLAELKKRVVAMGDDWSAMREAIREEHRANMALIIVDYAAYLKSLKED